MRRRIGLRERAVEDRLDVDPDRVDDWYRQVLMGDGQRQLGAAEDHPVCAAMVDGIPTHREQLLAQLGPDGAESELGVDRPVDELSRVDSGVMPPTRPTVRIRLSPPEWRGRCG